MKKFSPIFLIWIAFGLSILTLLAKLQIFYANLLFTFQIAAGIVLVASIVWLWILFAKMSVTIKDSIEKWDQDMKQDIPKFLQTRRVRLASMMSLMLVLFCLQLVFSIGSNKKMSEVFSYVLIICLFHCSMVATLILFKMFRTLAWVEHENHLEQMEEA